MKRSVDEVTQEDAADTAKRAATSQLSGDVDGVPPPTGDAAATAAAAAPAPAEHVAVPAEQAAVPAEPVAALAEHVAAPTEHSAAPTAPATPAAPVAELNLLPGMGEATLAEILNTNPELADGPANMVGADMNTLDATFKLELHTDAMAAVFGPAGMTITTIRERTGCRMLLLPPGSTPTLRLIEMGGAIDACLTAVGLILAEIQKSCSANSNICTPGVEGPSYNIRLFVRSDACGTIIGKGGATIQGIRTMSGANVKIETAEGSSYEQAATANAAGLTAPPDRAIGFTGLITSVHAAIIDVIPRVAQFLKQARAKGYIGFGGGGGASGASAGTAETGGAVAEKRAAQEGGVHPLEQGPGYVHPVSSTVIGRVIGPGGTQIREIRDKTGARVRVGNDKIAGTNDRPVTIWGSDAQVQMVIQMINEIAARGDDRPPRPRTAPTAAPPPSPYGYYPGYPPPAPPGYPPSYQPPPPPGYPPSYSGYAQPPSYQYSAAAPAPADASDPHAAYAAYYAQQHQHQHQQPQAGTADAHSAYAAYAYHGYSYPPPQ